MVSALVKRQHHMHMHMPHAHAHLARTSAHVTCDSGVVRLRVITGVSSEDLCIYGTVPRSHGIRRGSIGLKLFKVFDGDTQHITAVEPTTTHTCQYYCNAIDKISYANETQSLARPPRASRTLP